MPHAWATLLIAVHAHDTLCCLEVRKVPDQLALHKRIAVKDAMAHIQTLDLVFLAPHDTRELVHLAVGVAAVLGENHRTVADQLCPCIHLLTERDFRALDIRTAEDIPSKITVE